MSDWVCPCRAVNSSASVWCEACGTERADRARAPGPKVPESHAAWRPPVYPAPAPGDEALIRAEIAKIRAMLQLPPHLIAGESGRRTDDEVRSRMRRAPVDPAIRAELERRNAAGPEPVGAILPRAVPPARTGNG